MKNLCGYSAVLIIAVASALFLTQCGGSNTEGTLNLRLTDSAIDNATSVIVVFNGVIVHRAEPDEELLSFPFSNSIDLLALNGGEVTTILSNSVPEGHYTWIRLMVNSPAGSIVVNGVSYPLEIPSGEETGLKLNRGFDVPAGGLADFTIDFDLRKSVHLPASGDTYVLRPTLRIIDNTEAGSIEGTVTSSLITRNCSPAIYAFEGSVTPDDIDGNAPDPINTAVVVNDGGTYTYRIAFLEAGTYTVAFTCRANHDEPSRSDNLSFTGTSVEIVSANTTTTHDF